MTTLKDLARILDLSESTVSRALRDHPLTSIEQPCFEMGRLAAELLITQILKRDPFYRTQTRVLQARLILRDSICKLDVVFNFRLLARSSLGAAMGASIRAGR